MSVIERTKSKPKTWLAVASIIGLTVGMAGGYGIGKITSPANANQGKFPFGPQVPSGSREAFEQRGQKGSHQNMTPPGTSSKPSESESSTNQSTTETTTTQTN